MQSIHHQFLLLLLGLVLFGSPTMAKEPIRIMPVGDSITVGYTDNPKWQVPFEFGYRSGLYTRLKEAGYKFKFVGDSPEPYNKKFGDPSHGGTVEPKIDLRKLDQDGHYAFGGAAAGGLQRGIQKALRDHNPDIVLLKIGTNSQNREALKKLVDTIITTQPKAYLIIAEIMPKWEYQQGIVDYNSYIRETLVPSIHAKGIKNVIVVDQYKHFLTDPDDLKSIDQARISNRINHPDNVGYDRMAQTWFEAIDAIYTEKKNISGEVGRVFHADLKARKFEFLTETKVDPNTKEGKSRHTVYWTKDTRFYREDRQNSFEGLTGTYKVRVNDLDADNSLKYYEGQDFVALKITMYADGQDHPPGLSGGRNPGLKVRIDEGAPKHREAKVLRYDQEACTLRLRGPRAEVDVRSRVTDAVLDERLWKARVFGTFDQLGRFVAKQVDLFPITDPRLTDNPHLPRVLVIGDSISMNYHQAAKQSLTGIANYHRIDGNGGPSDRGVNCTELWLGDYKEPGFHWDVIQFNHGLHDLKQLYDYSSKTYGDHQVDIEAYKANLEKQIALLKRTGAVLMWCETTPVPNNSVHRWEQVVGRQKDEDLVFNRAAAEVLANHPEILINPLNQSIRQSEAFAKWWEGKDVHFWGRREQQIVGGFVADAIKRAVKVHAERQQIAAE